MEIRWVVWGTDCAHKAAVNYQKWPRNLGTKHICAHGETEQVDFSVPEKIFAVIELQKLERLNTSHHAGIDLAQSLSSVHCNWIWRGQKKTEADTAERPDRDCGDVYSQMSCSSVEENVL